MVLGYDKSTVNANLDFCGINTMVCHDISIRTFTLRDRDRAQWQSTWLEPSAKVLGSSPQYHKRQKVPPSQVGVGHIFNLSTLEVEREVVL